MDISCEPENGPDAFSCRQNIGRPEEAPMALSSEPPGSTFHCRKAHVWEMGRRVPTHIDWIFQLSHANPR
jgi:hypothetical protein